MPTAPDRSRGRTRLRVRLEGQRFGWLIVVRYAGQHRTAGGQFKHVWLCRCRCGTEATVRQDKLESGRTRSCGCLRLRAQPSPRERRASEAEFAMPFRTLLAELMAQHAIPWQLVRIRWLAPPTPIAATMGLPIRTKKAFKEIMHRTAPRVPDAGEAIFLAQLLNLRGAEKERFIGIAADARKRIEAYHAARSDE